jgi:hypothetical protein
MAINVDTQDLINYPGNVKRVTLDQESVVPQGYEGDEQFMLSFSTTAYSDNASRTQIQDMYITNFKAGWCKSSGFSGSKVILDSTHNAIEVKLDSTTSGISDGFYRIVLEHSDGVPVDAEVVAADLETKIREIANNLAIEDEGYRLAYMNSSVEFKGGRFWIVSGSLSQYYSGANRSSVKVRPSSVNDCSEALGFHLSTDSESLDAVGIKESIILTDYASASGIGEITIAANIGAVANDCMIITDRVNTDYFQIDTVTNGTLITFDPTKVTHDYDSGKAKVQLLREQDPDADPALWFSDIDKITRHGVKTIINQIDYSS